MGNKGMTDIVLVKQKVRDSDYFWIYTKKMFDNRPEVPGATVVIKKVTIAEWIRLFNLLNDKSKVHELIEYIKKEILKATNSDDK